MGSYVVRLLSTDGKPLTGGVLHCRSSRFGERKDAEAWLQAALDTNGEHCAGKIDVSSKTYPELFRHCPDPTMPAQAIGSKCFTCGKILTEKDARAFKEP